MTSTIRSYFDRIDRATEKCKTARTPEAVVAILLDVEAKSSGDAFYGGDGDELLGALYDAGWHTHRYAAPYYWVVAAPQVADGFLAYTEGDVSIGDNPACAEVEA